MPRENVPPPPTAADIRAKIGRARVPIYLLAARVHIHPVRLSAFINDRRPMPAELAHRILLAIDEEAAER